MDFLREIYLPTVLNTSAAFKRNLPAFILLIGLLKFVAADA